MLFVFGEDERRDPGELRVNSLMRPELLRYYANDAQAW